MFGHGDGERIRELEERGGAWWPAIHLHWEVVLRQVVDPCLRLLVRGQLDLDDDGAPRVWRRHALGALQVLRDVDHLRRGAEEDIVFALCPRTPGREDVSAEIRVTTPHRGDVRCDVGELLHLGRH